MSGPVFNSRDKRYKSKFGALAAGETVTFRLLLPCAKSGNAGRRAWLLIREDSQNTFECFEMACTDSYEEDCVWWTLDYTAEKIGLYWYCFEYESLYGTHRIYHIGNAVGQITNEEALWQLTVYRPDFKTPEWLWGGVIYQIFPDRFYNSGQKKNGVPADKILREDWGGQPQWQLNEKGEILNNDYFCGDLKGIEEKLDDLKALGVTCVYLNPIFEAHSNHRYNTADYLKVDPLLGNENDLKALCDSAHARGIRIILDGVFSHTGADSRYFNKAGRYDGPGAYNSKKSPYYSWYKFTKWPDKYISWWGIEILPEVLEENPDYLEFITGENGVLKKWLDAGIDGWRLDVADELPDIFIDKLRERVKSINPDALILGEVWEDASNKMSYGFRRHYLTGTQLDSVMNYPFANAIIDFILYYRTEDFFDRILSILENYPLPVVNTLMNLLDTHDTERILTKIAGEPVGVNGRYWQSTKYLSPQQRDKGVRLLRLASAIQFTLPGVPSVYYGDEAGMEGYKDPFNRGCYPWGQEDAGLIDWYKFLGRLRSACPALKDGAFVPISGGLGCIAYCREKDGEQILLIANRNEHEIDYRLHEAYKGMTALTGCEIKNLIVKIPAMTCAILGQGNWINDI